MLANFSKYFEKANTAVTINHRKQQTMKKPHSKKETIFKLFQFHYNFH